MLTSYVKLWSYAYHRIINEISKRLIKHKFALLGIINILVWTSQPLIICWFLSNMQAEYKCMIYLLCRQVLYKATSNFAYCLIYVVVNLLFEKIL